MAKKKKVVEKEEVFFVGVEDPIELRRSILESSKEIVQYLQRYERFKKVRAEKAEEIENLKTEVKEIIKHVRKLKTLLPKTKLRAKLHHHEEQMQAQKLITEIQEKRIITKPEITKKPKGKQQTEIEKLEAELGEIESRLTNLS